MAAALTMDTSARSAGAIRGGSVENDLTYIALTIAFFVLAGLLTLACDKIIGPDPVEAAVEEAEQGRVAA
jgi:hypothetical protein